MTIARANRAVGRLNAGNSFSGAGNPIRQNNFDLIRLFAAVQVVVAHTLYYLHVRAGLVPNFLSLFPGVPIFFFISGFLVSASWERSHGTREYAEKRARRIFPALWAVLLFEIALVLTLYQGHGTVTQFGEWIAAHATFGQDWNPKFLLGFGTGAINGSLWTIPIELSFYVSIPILYAIAARTKLGNVVFLAVVAASFAILFLPDWVIRHSFHLLSDFRLRVSPPPWMGMFVTGVMSRRYLKWIKPLVAGNLFWITALYIAIEIPANLLHLPFWIFGWNVDIAGVVSFAGLSATILSAAYTMSGLAARLLRGNDFSYGLYLFHMPMANAVISLGYFGWSAAFSVWLCSAIAAGCSWFIIERPILGRTRKQNLGKVKNLEHDRPEVSTA